MPPFRFLGPWWLALVLLVPVLLWWRARPDQRPAVLFSSLTPLRALPITFAQRIKRALPYLEGLALILLAVALARPQAGRVDVTYSTSGLAIQLVFDRSGSMARLDLDEDRFDRNEDTRLVVLKRVLEDFLDEGGELPGRPNDLVGITSFCGYPQAHSPLTFDHRALIAVLRDIEIPLPREGATRQEAGMLQATALGDGLVLALERLRQVEAKTRVIILLSDGRGNVGLATADEAAAAAQEMGVKVYAVGIGGRGVDLDEEALQSIADQTGGRYWNVRAASELRAAYEAIDKLERSDIESLAGTRWRDLYPWFGLAGLSLLLLHRVLLQTRFRSLP